jgi:hypothetical protein
VYDKQLKSTLQNKQEMWTKNSERKDSSKRTIHPTKIYQEILLVMVINSGLLDVSSIDAHRLKIQGLSWCFSTEIIDKEFMMYLKTTGRWLYPFSVFLLDLYWHGFLKINLWWAVYPPYPYPPCVRTSNSSIERLCLLDHFVWLDSSVSWIEKMFLL